MTAICLKAKNCNKTDISSSIFTGFNTETKSRLFIKQLTRNCISTILYLRKVFPEDYFEAKIFEGMTIKSLKPKNVGSYVAKIEQWLEGAFEAIDKKYLKRLMLDIQDGSSSKTLEIYTMVFNFNNEKESSHMLPSNALPKTNNKFSESSIEINTLKLLQMCYVVAQTYSSLPPQVKLSMRLSYFDNTPHDYQPPGYIAWNSSNPEFPKPARSIEIGVLGTQYHFFKLFNKSCLNEKFFKDLESQKENCISAHNNSTVIPKQTTDSQQEENFYLNKFEPFKTELNFNESNNNLQKTFNISSKSKKENTFIVTEKCLPTLDPHNLPKLKIKHKDLKNKVVRCACLSSAKSRTMFQCLACNFLVHSECFGILQFDTSKKIRFYCHLCHQTEKNFKCHDKVMIGLKNASDQQKLSLFRRILSYCTIPKITQITLKKMEKIAGITSMKNVVNIIMNKMIKIGVLIPQGKKKNHLINKQELTKKVVQYFYKVPVKPQTLPYSLRNIKTEKTFDLKEDWKFYKTDKESVTVLKDDQSQSNKISQQSCDIFC